VEHRLRDNGHMVIVIAEGAGQELMAADTTGTDMSGNKLLKDVGLWLSQNLKVTPRHLPPRLPALRPWANAAAHVQEKVLPMY
jgi:hypothetical protein